MHVYEYVLIHAYIYIIYIYMYIQKYMHMHTIYIYMYMYICICICTYIYICTNQPWRSARLCINLCVASDSSCAAITRHHQASGPSNDRCSWPKYKVWIMIRYVLYGTNLLIRLVLKQPMKQASMRCGRQRSQAIQTHPKFWAAAREVHLSIFELP